MEAHGTGLQYAYDRVKQALYMETDRGQALREAILACRKGGVLSVMGVHGVMDTFPLGLLVNKGINPAHRPAARPGVPAAPAAARAEGRAGPVIPGDAPFRAGGRAAPRGYDMFKHKTDGGVRAVFVP